MALLLVVAVVALASALGWAMLSSAALQGKAASNSARSLSADALAESGINLAMYYLQHPDRAPYLHASGYWDGTRGSSVAISSTVSGTVKVNVWHPTDTSDIWTYEIESIGTTAGDAENRSTRTQYARVYVQNEFLVRQAGNFNSSITLVTGMTFDGDVWSSNTLALQKALTPYPKITGYGYCKARVNAGPVNLAPDLGFQTAPWDGAIAPTAAEVNKYQTYKVGSTTYNADVITAASLGSTTKGITVTNPAGIYYKDASSGGPFVLNASTTINGTLVVYGDLQINGAGVIINNPQNGFPALVVTGNLEIVQPQKNLTVNGVVYVGGQLKRSGTTPAASADYSQFNVNGALMMGVAATPLATSPSYTIRTNVKYVAANAKAPELSPVLRTPKGVTILRWGP